MRTGKACERVISKSIKKVLVKPPYESKYGCMKIVENVLDNVKTGADYLFISLDNKLDKASKQLKYMLEKHMFTKIIKTQNKNNNIPQTQENNNTNKINITNKEQ